MGATPSFFTGEALPIDPSWDQVEAFLVKANGDPAVQALRLPTEAEWEYACRAGTDGPFGFDEPIAQALVNFNDGVVDRAVVVDGRLEVDWRERPSAACRMATTPAGSLPPNAWGLHEMHGNLWELCADGYDAECYAKREHVSVDPFVPPAADGLRVLRGGSWYDAAAECRAAARDAAGPEVRSNRIGFRVARTAEHRVR